MASTVTATRSARSTRDGPCRSEMFRRDPSAGLGLTKVVARGLVARRLHPALPYAVSPPSGVQQGTTRSSRFCVWGARTATPSMPRAMTLRVPWRPVEPPKGVTPQTVARGAGAARPTLPQRPRSSPTPQTGRDETSRSDTARLVRERRWWGLAVVGPARRLRQQRGDGISTYTRFPANGSRRCRSRSPVRRPVRRVAGSA